MINKKKIQDRQVLELEFGDNPDKLRGEYLDMYEGAQSEVLSITRIEITRASKVKAEEIFPIR